MSNKLNPVSVWALAAGGMVGGGIYTVLGVVIAVAAQWSWLAFAYVGILALTSTYSYVFLSNKFAESGGAFAFLEKTVAQGVAGSLAWMLILGYVLTISVYAYVFGHYLSFAFHGNPLIIRVLAAGIVVALIGLNLAGVGKMTKVEITIVSANLLLLLALGVYGLGQWDSTKLVAGIEPRPIWSSLFGGAAIFMAYEGFQLLSYEYDKIRDAQKYFMPVLVSATGFVVALYIVVTLGACFLGGATSLVDFKEIALSIAAKKAFGTLGVVVITIAACFATAAAINSTLFSTAQLSKRIANDNELPQWFRHTNSNDIPDRSIVLLGVLAGLLAVIGSLSSLVEAASLVFITTFGIVNWLCFKESGSKKWIPCIGLFIAMTTALSLLLRLAISKPVPLAGLVLLIVLILLGRPQLLQHTGK